MATCKAAIGPACVLELTNQEAEELAWVLGELAPDPPTDGIYNALLDAAVQPRAPEVGYRLFLPAALQALPKND